VTPRQVTPRFKVPKSLRRERKARDERPGMSAKYLAAIRKLPSCISGRSPCEAHHLRIKEERGVSMRATDRWAVPLTWDEHHDVHRVGSRREEAWFKQHGIDARALAEALWNNKHSEETMLLVLRAHVLGPSSA
jgi:hypothetical protein